MINLDDARRAYESAKVIQHCVNIRDYERIKADYEAALLADAQANLDAMGVVIGETMVVACDKDGNLAGSSFGIHRIEAVLDDGRVFVFGDRICTGLSNIRPYVAPVVKEMVLESKVDGKFTSWSWIHDDMRFTLSGITPADLDGMTGRITGTYTVEKL